MHEESRLPGPTSCLSRPRKSAYCAPGASHCVFPEEFSVHTQKALGAALLEATFEYRLPRWHVRALPDGTPEPVDQLAVFGLVVNLEYPSPLVLGLPAT